MYKNDIEIRPRYAETDQMGYVYYGNYAQYFEVARVEMMRSLGLSYRQMEEDGIMLPVVNFEIRYLKPAFYDDLLTIKTVLPEIPVSKIIFRYETYNESEVLLNKAETILVFVDKKTGRPCRAPEKFVERLTPHF